VTQQPKGVSMPEHVWNECPKCEDGKKRSPLLARCPKCGAALKRTMTPYARSKGAGRKKDGGKK
jgi:hypothetical protein